MNTSKLIAFPVLALAVTLHSSATFAQSTFASQSALDFFNGKWTCNSPSGTESHKTFSRDVHDQWLVMRNDYQTEKGREGEYIEFFRVNHKDKILNVSIGSIGTAFGGISDGWNKNMLEFNGATTGDIALNSRVDIQKNNDKSFTRDIFIQDPSGAWQQISDETCKR